MSHKPKFYPASREQSAPPIDRATVEWLSRQFPERSPRPVGPNGDTYPSLEEVWFDAGKRYVVRLLENVLEQQENKGNVPKDA